MGTIRDALRRGPDFCCAILYSGIHLAFGAAAGGREYWMAHPHRAADSKYACYPARGFVFFHHGGPAMVRMGMAL